jgi:hypothetical protein
VEERLQKADSPMSPADLAEEYGCTNGHIRNLLSDLRDMGEVERVAHGQYEATADDGDGDTPELPAELRADSEGNAEAERDDTPPDETAQETGEPVDGQVQSVDHDTTAGSPVKIEEREQADVELSESEEGDSDGFPNGWALVIATFLIVALILVSSMNQGDETGDESPDEEAERNQPNTAQWGN